MKLLKFLLLSIVCVYSDAQGMPINRADYITMVSTYDLLFSLDSDPSIYNHNPETGLNYVNNMVITCEKYNVHCNIDVVIQANAFLIAVKTRANYPYYTQKGVNYNYDDLIIKLMKHGVRFTTPRDNLEKYHLKQEDLLSGIELINSPILYTAGKVKQGALLIKS